MRTVFLAAFLAAFPAIANVFLKNHPSFWIAANTISNYVLSFDNVDVLLAIDV